MEQLSPPGLQPYFNTVLDRLSGLTGFFPTLSFFFFNVQRQVHINDVHLLALC